MRKPFLLLFLLVGCCMANAKIQLPQLFQSGMVVQRGKPIPVWGKADPQEQIVIRWQKKQYTTTADEQGKWRIDLPKTKAGGPYTLTIGEHELTDVLVGDVWLCSGQSNIDVHIERGPVITGFLLQRRADGEHGAVDAAVSSVEKIHIGHFPTKEMRNAADFIGKMLPLLPLHDRLGKETERDLQRFRDLKQRFNVDADLPAFIFGERALALADPFSQLCLRQLLVLPAFSDRLANDDRDVFHGNLPRRHNAFLCDLPGGRLSKVLYHMTRFVKVFYPSWFQQNRDAQNKLPPVLFLPDLSRVFPLSKG